MAKATKALPFNLVDGRTIRIGSTRDLSDVEAKRMQKELDRLWPEITMFIRKHAIRIDHRLTVYEDQFYPVLK